MRGPPGVMRGPPGVTGRHTGQRPVVIWPTNARRPMSAPHPARPLRPGSPLHERRRSESHWSSFPYSKTIAKPSAATSGMDRESAR